MRLFFLLFFLYLLPGSAQAQTLVDWEMLAEVNYVRRTDISTRYIIQQPRFSPTVKALEGKPIEITGYILPLDVDGSVYALSRYPYAACFFCGGAGIASVMDVWFAKRDKRYHLDEQIKLRGILRLSKESDGLMYLLDEAVEVE